MSGFSDFNQKIVHEFRANQGEVGGPFEGATLLLLHHTGARSGVERVNPVAYQRLDPRTVAVFASKGGAPTNPDWYWNLVANPETVIEIGEETVPVRARVLGEAERAPIWEKQKAAFPGFAEYEQKTERVIPVVVLEQV